MVENANNRVICYVSIPFGIKADTDFTLIYKSGIAKTVQTHALGDRNVILFREDEPQPELSTSHLHRLERHGYASQPLETRLREEIQKHIILADFIVADISHSIPNVMLEVGFAQALGKRIIYLTHTYEQNPSNLGDLKRFLVYKKDDLDHLRINLSLKIDEVITETTAENAGAKERGGEIEYFSERQKTPLAERLENAQHIIQILTTNLTTVSANYRETILKAINRAEQEGRKLEVIILTSDPTNPFIRARALQLNEDPTGYQSELEGSLKSVAAKLLVRANCSIYTYRDFPVQLWHRIDGTIYVGSPSVLRRSRQNCVFAVSVFVPGIKETFLDHFDELKRKSTPYSPNSSRETDGDKG